MERDRQNVFEVKHYEGIGNIEDHADKESPLRALAGKIPEENEDAGNQAIDDEIERESTLTSVMGERVNKVRET